MKHVIVHGDGIEAMLHMDPRSVDLVIADLPYGATKAKWDRTLDPGRVALAIDHCLRPEGIACLFMSTRLAFKQAPALDEWRRFAYELVWRKNRATQHLNAKKRPMPAHELIYVFGDAALSRYNVQHTYGHAPMTAATRVSKSELYGSETVTKNQAGATHRYQTSVLEIDTVANDTDARIHSSQKPVELLRWLIRAYSRPGELVVDPCCGSGSTVQAARLEGRPAYGYEIDQIIWARAHNWLSGTDSPLFQRAGTLPLASGG